MSVYTEKELVKQTFFQRLFKRLPKENFIIEFENILARNEISLSKLSQNKINELIEKYKVNFAKQFITERENLYRKYLKSVLEDEKITDTEKTALNKIKNLLSLNEGFVKKELTEATNKIYQKKVYTAVFDGKLDEEEKKQLTELKNDLLISESTAKSIYDSEAKNVLNKYLKNAVADERLSPDEEKQINEIAKNLGAQISYETKTKELLDKYRLFWVIENGELPTIQSDINLQKSESLYFMTDIDWLEMKTVTKRVNYAGVSTRIRICKGVYFKVGSIAPERVTEDVWRTVDSGKMYLTNKRIIFMGQKGNKTIKLDKVLSFTPYQDGVQLEKDTGKNPFFKFDYNVDVYCMLLSRLMNEASK